MIVAAVRKCETRCAFGIDAVGEPCKLTSKGVAVLSCEERYPTASGICSSLRLSKYRIFYWDNRDEWIYGHKLPVESICFRKAHLPNTKETNKARWALAQGATHLKITKAPLMDAQRSRAHRDGWGWLGMAGDGWGRLGTAGDGWGRPGTPGTMGSTWQKSTW